MTAANCARHLLGDKGEGGIELLLWKKRRSRIIVSFVMALLFLRGCWNRKLTGIFGINFVGRRLYYLTKEEGSKFVKYTVR